MVNGKGQAPSAEKHLASREAIDPLIVEAAKEVDGSLLQWMLSLSLRERLRACSNASRALGRFRDAASRPR
jgi:hypothetical protein